MKRLIVFSLSILFLALLPGMQQGAEKVEKVILKDGADFEEKLADNNVFFKKCNDFEFDPAKKVAYFLDTVYGKIFKVEFPTGKLIKTISYKGQGPGELHYPVSMAIKGKKIIVLDTGFNGIKIFSTDGEIIKEFRLERNIGSRRRMAVNDAGEIFIGAPNYTEKMLTVYDMEGRKLRTLIPFNEEGPGVHRRKMSRDQFKFKIDKEGNVFLLFFFIRKLAKYDAKGNLLWERDIKNELLDKSPKNEYLRYTKKTVSSSRYIFNFETVDNGDVIVGHAYGGCVYDKDGVLKRLINRKIKLEDKTVSDWSLYHFKIRNNILMDTESTGGRIKFYNAMEVIK